MATPASGSSGVPLQPPGDDNYRLLVESAPVAVLVHQHGLIAYVNDAAVRLLGAASRERLIGHPIIDIVHPDWREVVRERIRRVYETGLSNPMMEQQWLRLDGSVIDVEVTGAPCAFCGRAAAQVMANDITARRRSEERLRASEERFRALAEESTAGIWQITPDGETLYVNDAMCRLLDVGAPTDVVGQSYDFYFSQASLEVIRREHAKRPSGQSSTYEAELIGASGRRRNVLISGAPIMHPDGSLACQIATIVDITERKDAEQGLRESEARLRLALAAGCMAAWDWNLATGTVTWSGESATLFGDAARTAAELPEGIVDLTHAEDRGIVREAMAESRQLRTDFAAEFRATGDDGAVRWLEARGRFQFDAEGRPARMIGVARDITERKQAEAALQRAHDELDIRVRERTAELTLANERLREEFERRTREQNERLESEQRLQAILDNTTAVIYLKDISGRYLLINRRYEELFHVDRRRIVGRTDFDVFPAETAALLQANDRRVLQADAPLELEETAPHDDGPHTYISIKFPLRHTSGALYGVCGISTDITERKRAEEQARRHQERLFHVSRVSLMGEMAAGLAHELNQPLGAIMNFVRGSVRRLKGDAPDLPTICHVLEQVIAQADRAARIIRSISEMTRRRQPRRDVVSLNAVVTAAVQLIGTVLRDHRVELRMDLGDTRPVVGGDSIQLEQVLMNLMMNAIEAMRDTRSDDRILTIRSQVNREHAEVSVSDRGCGLPPGDEHWPFEAFHSTKEDGMGMGLTISRSIVEAHQGELWFHRNSGRGLTFVMSLPILAGPAERQMV